MTRTYYQPLRPQQPTDRTSRRRTALIACVIATLAAAGAVVEAYGRRYDPEPYHTSMLSGEEWVNELDKGHEDRMRDNLGVQKHVFQQLKHELCTKGGLRRRRHVTNDEQLAVFLYQLTTNLSIRKMGERFQHSNETISRHVLWIYAIPSADSITRSFRNVLFAVVSDGFRSTYMTLPDPNLIPEVIRSNPKFYPFFKDALGAIDGTHMYVHPPSFIKARYRDRNGNLTQNVLAVCNFMMFFVFILSGWEGSAADSFLYQQALISGLTIPEGKYYLADAGFASCRGLLVPYRNVRYHLREWQSGNKKPQNPQELFNLRHSQLRNVIERIFGAVKKKYRMAAEASHYPISIQSLVPLAVALISNFNNIHDSTGFRFEVSRSDVLVPAPHGDSVPTEGVTAEEVEEADARRDAIAEAMWASYEALQPRDNN